MRAIERAHAFKLGEDVQLSYSEVADTVMTLISMSTEIMHSVDRIVFPSTKAS